MTEAEQDLNKLLADPRESLGMELKQWINPSTPGGKAKIAKACIAMRNNNGGRLVIGFTDDGRPDETNVPVDVRAEFHADIVQSIVSSVSSEQFGVDVSFVDKAGQIYPIITVPSGVRTPVAAKSTIKDNDGRELVRDDAVYVRSFNANNTVSSTQARRRDWDRLTRICFDNREADVGGFVRRHLAALNPDTLAAFVPAIAGLLNRPSISDKATHGLDHGRARLEAELKRREMQLYQLGLSESLILVEGAFPQQTVSGLFLANLLQKAPRHTGWPPWVYLPNAENKAHRPYVYELGWEALIDDRKGNSPLDASFDFWRIEPRGLFYLLRVLEDDLVSNRGIVPGTQLDFLLQTYRVAEVISTGLSFGRSLGCDETKTSLVFGFRWSGLEGRQLTSWARPLRAFQPRGTAVQNSIVTAVTAPLETPPSGIAPHVENAVRDLFALFGGMEFEGRVIEGIVAEAIGLSTCGTESGTGT